jgi:hypothetical protein
LEQSFLAYRRKLPQKNKLLLLVLLLHTLNTTTDPSKAESTSELMKLIADESLDGITQAFIDMTSVAHDQRDAAVPHFLQTVFTEINSIFSDEKFFSFTFFVLVELLRSDLDHLKLPLLCLLAHFLQYVPRIVTQSTSKHCACVVCRLSFSVACLLTSDDQRVYYT